MAPNAYTSVPKPNIRRWPIRSPRRPHTSSVPASARMKTVRIQAASAPPTPSALARPGITATTGVRPNWISVSPMPTVMTVERATSTGPATGWAAPGADTVDTASSVHSGSAVNADPLEEGRMAALVTVYSNVG